ncbi:MAG: ComF family protein, partial [Clostridia bacterium]|nr:ComF family protein [Clostridia bacterium]
FNQSECIASQYAMIKGLPYLTVAEKWKDTPKQSLQLSAKARAANVKGCYRVIDEAAVVGKTIVLVDDVYTTGATLRECARTLRKAGAACVIGVCGCVSGIKKPAYEAHFVRKCASVIFAFRRVILLRSYIWTKVQVILPSAVLELKPKVLISLCRKAK